MTLNIGYTTIMTVRFIHTIHHLILQLTHIKIKNRNYDVFAYHGTSSQGLNWKTATLAKNLYMMQTRAEALK